MHNKYPSMSANREELLALALIKQDRYDGLLLIHLIAALFHLFLSPKDLRTAFFEHSILMYNNAFPKRLKKPGATRADPYNVWHICQL